MALIDPFGGGAYGYVTKYWTAAERNTRLPEITGVILWNRVIWLSVGFGFLTAAWLLYRPEQKGARRFRKREVEPASQRAAAPEGSRPLAEPRHDAAAARAQLLGLARFDMKSVFRSPAFFVLLGIGFVNSAGGLWFANQICTAIRSTRSRA